MPSESILAQAITEQSTPLVGAHTDFDLLLDRIGDARLVLLGEATHGSHEFYRIRAELTKRLIREKGFAAVAAEADWPDAYRVNRFIRGTGRDIDAADALFDFRRFPQWMWRNADTLDLIGWLRAHNDRIHEPAHRVGFYGLDLYSLHASMSAVLAYLDQRDPGAARRARERYACFDAFGDEPQHYGHSIAAGIARDCEQEVLAQLLDLLKRRGEMLRHDGVVAEDAQFEAEQNARVVAHAEEYYRMMYVRGVSTWNLRDTHMADTLDALAGHIERCGRSPKIVVWAHNSHVGDSAAMAHRAEREEITLGHLCRLRHQRDTVVVGFTTYDGTVTAASDWGGQAERKTVRPALPGSYEALFHATGVPSFVMLLDDLGELTAALHEPRLERAIGVVYRPQTERWSHYFDVRLADQLDAVIHVDQTRALEPLERTALWERGELAETYPTGL
ncbi:MAG TPA: erythromycin esterase family protein [Kofleriaceae bacterium]|nr:erythromycin esterase family protein [Kofleriaceae bacterium]